ncbi:MAG: TolC family protein [Akkermansiaceae bacterium]|nr:TolC family protein [Armatimonadota bacterium]
MTFSRATAVSFGSIVSSAAILGVLSPAAWSQDAPVAQEPANPPPVAQAPANSPTAPQTQPNAPTPPTPLPTKTPDTERLGLTAKGVIPTTRFDFKTRLPGQAQEGDPDALRTLDQALEVAYARNPSILIAFERAIRTNATIAQILGARGPQISGSLGYSRLLNSQSGLGGAGTGLSPSQIQNPFTVGLQNTPPGVAPVTLSSGGGATTSSGGVTTTGTSATGSTNTASSTGGTATTRSAVVPGGRQTDTPSPQDPGDSNPGNDPGGTGNQNQNAGLFGGGGNLDQASARITIAQFIDITGILRTAQQIGDLEQALNRLEILRLRQETALNVRTGYYSVLRTAAFVRVNEASVAQSEEQLRVTRAQQNAGVASAFDVLRAQTQLENNRQALIQSRNQLLIAKNGFANTVGVDPSTPVDLADIPEIPALPQLDEAVLLSQAFDRRPEYYQSDTNILKATKNVRLARRNLEPFLNASVTGAYNLTEPAFGTNKDTGSAGLTLSIPLWDGGATREAVKAARADERQSLIQKDQFARGIKAEVQQAIIAVRDAYERQTTTADTVTQAREALRLANVRYQAGVGTQLEINDAQTALTQAETNQVNARYDYLSAIARLSRAVGEPA